MTNTISPQLIRERNAVLLLPLLIVPLLTWAFHALGGGREPEPPRRNSLMTTLPGPILEEDFKDKLALYEEAAKDSLEKAEAIRKDPYARLMQKEGVDQIDFTSSSYHVEDPLFPEETPKELEATEEAIEGQLSKLQQLIQSPQTAEIPGISVTTDLEEDRKARRPVTTGPRNPKASPEVERLESLMAQMQRPAGEDPELKQIEAMLDKILDVQHPERVTQRLKERKEEGETPSSYFRLAGEKQVNQKLSASLPETMYAYPQNGFYGLEEPGAEPKETNPTNIQNGIRATVSHTQKVKPGSTLELTLDDPAYLAGQALAKGTSLYGTCTYRGDRLVIDISSVRIVDGLYPVNLTVYGMDGLPGIHIPGSMLSEVAEEEAGRSLQGLSLSGGNAEMVAAEAGINMASKLLRKQKKQPNVTVRAGHPVLLVSL
ncbi:conjugative transposon protein TraM [Roseivirga sp. BDSF3-8]|uniref:conjugative transposon protein TraM n=1 Tax=Roseivirga sp. BDSF3-8 TaxID=3241598 RepID=UPI0035319B2D